MILLLLSCLLISLLALVSWRLFYLSTATRGPAISPEASRPALLVIDMQVGIIQEAVYSHQPELTEAIQTAIAGAAPQMPVIFIQHSIPKYPLDSLLTAGRLQTGAPATAFVPNLLPQQPVIFPKHRADAFSNADFESYLGDRQIKELYLLGADANACVYRTALGALNRGYHVTILEDGLFATSPKIKAQMLETYAKHGIKRATVATFLREQATG